MADPLAAPCISVLAGTNGAGKSSIAGAMLRRKGADYFNPDEAARRIRQANPGSSAVEGNSAAWNQGKRLLEAAIAGRLDFVFETTLGGNTITALLERAIAEGFDVRVWYAGLASPELHIARVRARVARGGHDIPEADIRKRYDAGRRNLIHLLPGLAELWVYDNSAEADPAEGHAPAPVLVLHVDRGKIVSADPPTTPHWAKPIVLAALKKILNRLAGRCILAPMNLIDFVPQYGKMLKNLDRWLDKAAEHAKAKGFELDTLVHARLAPDQYSLDRQIQSACDTAKFSAAYLSGTAPPAHPDTEKTIPELRARIKSCLQFLETVTSAEGGETRKVAPKWLEGKWIKGDQYLVQMSLPNFYFHITTAYAILRHNGVNLGKTDFIGSMPVND